MPPDRFQEQKAREELPFGSLPVLDVITSGGTVSAAQSNAILRFVGRRAGLYPVDDPLRALKVDEALDFGRTSTTSSLPASPSRTLRGAWRCARSWRKKPCLAGPATSSGSSSPTVAPASWSATR